MAELEDLNAGWTIMFYHNGSWEFGLGPNKASLSFPSPTPTPSPHQTHPK